MFRRELTVYRDVLESRQVERTFKLVNPKYKDRASVHNGFLSLNFLVCWVEICKHCICLFLIQQRSLYVIDFRCNLSNYCKQKRIKATEVYLFWIFNKKTFASYW